MTTTRPFNIRHLAAMAATVRLRSVTKAALSINLTQPALTQLITKLERELDCALFERGSNGMSPTEPAILLARRVDAAIALIGSHRVTGVQARAFTAVARFGSYAAAAASTGLSSASLHRAVSDLSVALGHKLIERRGRSIRLTSVGERKARSLNLALSEIGQGYDEVEAWLGRRSGRIVIGAMPLSRASWLPRTILQFTSLYPGVSIRIVEGSYSELSGPLRDGEIDLVLGAQRDKSILDDLVQIPVFRDQPAIIMRNNHPLTECAQLTGEELVRYPWIVPTTDAPLRRYWETMMQQAKVRPPDVWIECGSVLTIRELVTGSDALTLLSPSQLRVELGDGLLAQVPAPFAVERDIGMIYRNGWRPTTPQRVFMDILTELGGNLNSHKVMDRSCNPFEV